jgi:hypothetical protein
MDPQNEFLSARHDQLIEQSQLIGSLRKYGLYRSSLQGRVIDSLGDGMISCGSWLKRVSGSKNDQNSSVLLSQN